MNPENAFNLIWWDYKSCFVGLSSGDCVVLGDEEVKIKVEVRKNPENSLPE